MKVGALLLGLAVCLAAAAFVLAKNANAPPLSSTNTTLYAHHDAADTVELDGWMNTVQADGDDTAMGPAASCVPHSGNRAVDEELLGLVGEEIDRNYTFDLFPPQKGFLKLDPEGNLTATIHAGAGSCFGSIDITSTLVAGEETIAEGMAEGHWFDNTASADAYPHVNVTMRLNESLTAVNELQWRIRIAGETGGAVFLGVSEAKGSTQLELPVLDVTEQLPGKAAEPFPAEGNAEYAFPDPTNATHEYNWSSSGGPYELIIDARLDQGSVHVRLANSTDVLFDETLRGETTKVHEFVAEEEAYDLSVNFTEAVGETKVQLVPDEHPGDGGGAPNATQPPAPSPSQPLGGSALTDSNGSAADANETKEEELMPVPLWVPAGAIALLLLWRRRR